MSKLIAVAGLPGSSKSYYLKEQSKQFGYKAVSEVTQDNWRSWPKLRVFLNMGFDCITDSADFTVLQRRKDLEALIKRDCTADIDVVWHFFENNPAACLTNALRDCILKPEREFQNRIKNLFNMARQYEIPEGATVLPVYNPGAVILPYGEFSINYGATR